MHAATRLDRSGWAFALALACIYGPSASPGLTTGVAAAAFLIDAWANEMGNHYGGLSAADGRWPGSSLHPDTLIRCVWGCRRNIQARMPIRVLRTKPLVRQSRRHAGKIASRIREGAALTVRGGKV